MKTLKIKKNFLAIFTGILFLSQLAIAQPSKRTTAWNYLKEKQYDKAVEAIDQAIKHESTISDAKTWHFRAIIYHDIALTEDIAPAYPDALSKSLESVKEVNELDTKSKFTDKDNKILIDLATMFFNNGVESYNIGIQNSDNAGFKQALEHFSNYFESMDLLGELALLVNKTLYDSGIDPRNVYLYAGISAQQIGDNTTASGYYSKLISVKYPSISPYIGLIDIKLEEGDTTAALQVVAAGKKYLKGDDLKNINIRELVIYQASGKLNELIEKLESAITNDPEDVDLYVTLGETYYAISQQQYIQSELVGSALKKEMAKAEITGQFGDPGKTETVTDEGTEVERLFYGQKYLDFVDSKLVAWQVDLPADNTIDHAELASQNLDNAIKQYKKSIEIAQDTVLLFALNSKIGTIYFNQGVDVYNKSILERDDKKLKALEEEYMALFDNAIPYMDKAMELKPGDKTHIPHLIKIYLLKGDMEKVGELNKLK